MKKAWVLLLLVVLAVPGFAQAPDDKLIVPGQRIGKWTLEMTINDLVRMNGPRNGAGRPAEARAPGADMPEEAWAHRWDDMNLVAITMGRESQKVIAFRVDGEQYPTDKGIRVGSSRGVVQSAYGQPSTDTVPTRGWWTGVHDQIGLAVGVDAGNVVWGVTVFLPGTAKQCYRF